jgi:phage repressor protein C with HTH and peptisase S24 domain
MPASVVTITGRREGTYVLLEAALPGRLPRNIGVILMDAVEDRAWVRMLERYQDLAEPDDAEVLEALEEDIRAKVAETGAEAYLRGLEDSLSNVLRVTGRQTVAVDAFTRVVDRLYSDNVAPIPVRQFGTHVPLYSLRAAAGSLGEEMQSEAEDWVRAPEGMRLTPDLFVGHVVGKSMEPRIPDGSLNLFRANPVGSRQNKILLIERFGLSDDTARYTVKKYTSRKVSSGEDQWRHEQIRLEPLNPEFEAWDVEPDGFAVVAEWLRVIE